MALASAQLQGSCEAALRLLQFRAPSQYAAALRRWQGVAKDDSGNRICSLQAGSHRRQRYGKCGIGSRACICCERWSYKGLALFAGPIGWALDAMWGGVVADMRQFVSLNVARKGRSQGRSL